MRICELLCGVSWRPSGGLLGDEEISSPATDSRSVEKDGLFICLDGTHRDGHDYAAEAIRRGAAACVCSHPVAGVPCAVTEDTRLAAAFAWYNYYRRPDRKIRVFGITGTNGKTSTAAFLSSIFETSGLRCGVIGTLGCRVGNVDIPCQGAENPDVPAAMTTPDPGYLYSTLAEMERLGVDVVVMEVSSHALYYKKTEPMYFECGIFTGLSPEHLDCHGDMENYFQVKASMFDRCRKRVINGLDAWGRRLGGYQISDSMISNVDVSPSGTEYDLRLGRDTIHIESQVPGNFTVINTALAAACASYAGVSADNIAKGIAAVKGIPGRMEKIVGEEDYGFDVFIDYAHTPAALEAVLKSFEEDRGRHKKLTVVFGCGGDRDREKRPLMGQIACEFADRVIVTSDNPRNENRMDIIRDILGGTDKNVCTIPDRADAITYALEIAAAGDIILLCGKGHENYETGPEGKRPFSERSIVETVLKKKFGK